MKCLRPTVMRLLACILKFIAYTATATKAAAVVKKQVTK